MEWTLSLSMSQLDTVEVEGSEPGRVWPTEDRRSLVQLLSPPRNVCDQLSSMIAVVDPIDIKQHQTTKCISRRKIVPAAGMRSLSADMYELSRVPGGD